MSSHVTELRWGGEILSKCVKNVIFLDVGTQWNLTPDSNFTFRPPPSYRFWEQKKKKGKRKREKVAVETCQLPFTLAEECWQALTMLSVSAPDKSSQFINEIDGIAYQQFLYSVFSHASSQRHPYRLTSSYPLCPSPGLLRCFNIFLVLLLKMHPQQRWAAFAFVNYFM